MEGIEKLAAAAEKACREVERLGLSEMAMKEMAKEEERKRLAAMRRASFKKGRRSM